MYLHQKKGVQYIFTSQRVKMDSFYVHLQSDASWRHYSDNTRTNYRNHLAIPINVIANQYEVALAELTYTYNEPFIKADTTLYTVREANKAAVTGSAKSIRYEPEIYSLRGPNYAYQTRKVDKEAIDLAKENTWHIDYANTRVTPKTGDIRVVTDVLMLEGSFDIIASKKLTSTKELAEDMNEQLKVLNIQVMYSESYVKKETVKMVKVVHNNPLIISLQDLVLYDKIQKHFQIGSQDEKYYANGKYLFSTITINEELNIEVGEKLCRVHFFKGEIHYPPEIQFKNEKIDQRVRLLCIAPRRIHSVDDLIKRLNAASPQIQFEMDKERCVVKVQLPKESKLVINERVQAVLGLDLDSETLIPANEMVTFRGTQSALFEVGSRKVYAYTDIIEEQRVGDQMAPLLRIIEYNGRNNELVMKNFNNLHYVNVSKDFIDSIRIYLKTEIGEDLPLTFGTTSCTLHFRERRL